MHMGKSKYKHIPWMAHYEELLAPGMGRCIAGRSSSRSFWSLSVPPAQDGYTLAVTASKLEAR